jgi:uncharacterized membrane protein YoaK (UPF0700 family)
MTDRQTRSGRGADGAEEDLGMYGIVWLGLIAAAVGAVIGVVMMFAQGESSLLGAATVAVSIALGALLYLIGKVLDRQ